MRHIITVELTWFPIQRGVLDRTLNFLKHYQNIIIINKTLCYCRQSAMYPGVWELRSDSKIV